MPDVIDLQAHLDTNGRVIYADRTDPAACAWIPWSPPAAPAKGFRP